MKLVDQSQDTIYTDPAQPVAARVADLISRMTLEEKVSQMIHGAAGIERLGVPAYNWWNECLHGVGRAGIATVFPAGDRDGGDVEHRFAAPCCRRDLGRGAREASRRDPGGWEHRLVLRPDVLDAEYQHLPRSALGTRAGDLWRGPVSHVADGRVVYQGFAG